MVFVGRDSGTQNAPGIPRYAHCRGTADKFRQDVSGSDKTYNFSYQGDSDQLFVFEAPIDMLSFIPMTDEVYQSLLNILANRRKPKVEMIVDGYSNFILIDKDEHPKVALHIENEMRWAMKKYKKFHPDQPLPNITLTFSDIRSARIWRMPVWM